MLTDKAHDQNTDVPGGVYLCQISKSVSCGACCGLYNLPDLSRGALFGWLKKRTSEFANTPREVSEILHFGQRVSRETEKNPPYSKFHHCPYVGLIGNDHSRIGCLLHPLADGNNGIDFRGLSYYGGMACRIYFCPSYRFIPKRIKIIIRAAIDDWYSYGLIITEHDFINACFQKIEMHLGYALHLKKISSKTLSAIQQLLTIKIYWPFRNPQWPVVNYFFEDQQYSPPEINYPNPDSEPSQYHTIFYTLGSTFSTVQAMHQAEDLLKMHVDHIIQTILSDSKYIE